MRKRNYDDDDDDDDDYYYYYYNKVDVREYDNQPAPGPNTLHPFVETQVALSSTLQCFRNCGGKERDSDLVQ
jgi:hypothetical protein